MKRSFLLITLVACTVSLDDGSHALLSSAEYTLTWDTADVTWETQGWSTTTDLGYVVHVENGWVGSYGLSLVACEDVIVRGSDVLWSLVGVQSAYAGHSGDEIDPSALVLDQMESLATPIPHQYGPYLFAPDTYCRVHYVMSYAIEEAEAEGRNLTGSSLWLEGTITSPNGDRWPLDVQSDVAHGALRDLPQLANLANAALLTEHVEIRVTRALATMFDGIDFNQEPSDLDFKVLGNLTRYATVDALRSFNTP